MPFDFKGFFHIRTLPVLAGVLWLAGCATPVHVEQDAAAGFQAYHRYAWLAPSPGAVRDPILDSQIFEARVQRAVQTALRERGFEEVAADAAPDFLVTYHTVSKQKVESSGGSFSFGFIDAFPHGFGSVAVGGPEVQSREQGTLMLDVIDGRSKRLAWRGWMDQWVSQGNYSDQAVTEAVQRILAKFPAP